MQMKRTAEGVVIALHSYRSEVWNVQYAGLCRYFLPYKWEVLDVRFPRNADFSRVRRLMDAKNAVGIVTSLQEPLPDDILARQPVVCFDCDASERMRGCPYIRHDASHTAHLAVTELLSLSLRSFAYVHAPGALYWSRMRCDAFKREVAAHNCEVAPSFSMPAVNDRRRLTAAMARWVRGLPKPCGVFAANDETAALLLCACERVGVRVPQEIAVVGVDDNQSICTSSKPTLSSVAPDWNAGAFMAALTLDRMLKGRQVDMDVTFRPLGLIRRESTACAAGIVNQRVVRAVDLIRSKACEGLKARDVVREMGCSRRLAELRFREVTGRSILEEVRRTRFENARRFLSHTEKPTSVVANMSGWASVTSFCREFKENTGLSPMDWRRKEFKKLHAGNGRRK